MSTEKGEEIQMFLPLRHGLFFFGLIVIEETELKFVIVLRHEVLRLPALLPLPAGNCTLSLSVLSVNRLPGHCGSLTLNARLAP